MTTTTSRTLSLSHDEIARQAYMLYEKRGGEPGHEMEDWLQAEASLKSEQPEAVVASHADIPSTNRQANWQSAKPGSTRGTKRLK